MERPGDDILKLLQSVDKKVRAIFAELGDDRAARLKFQPDGDERAIQDIICKALKKEHGNNAAWEIAFHLMDWRDDAAFIVAVVMFPEKFTKAEIRARTSSMLVHAPNHIMAAAHWMGHELRDVFELGLKIQGRDEFPDAD